ncbi:uncharacterized protein LOC116173135 isoform X2 [Photinus pyralis]|uniref:uncharacterized protein LOC116173135 isoform X2 n=1 Tax=Photinus pyralis TaxID=7054 RepID=UPI001266EA92|nr:uncharacterized protein LOC116173135 isoform X2 [Photinus pyralis]
MHAMDESLVERKRKKKKKKRDDIIRQNSFTNDADFRLVNVINKDGGDVTEIKKHKKKRKNLEYNRNEAFVTQNGIDAEVIKHKRKKSHSGELNKLNNITVGDGLRDGSVSKKHRLSNTPHHFDVDQNYSKRNDFDSNADKDSIIEIKDERVGVKKKKKKHHKNLDTMPPPTDKHKHKDGLLPNTSLEKETLPAQNCNGVKKKKKKRHKDETNVITEKQHKEIRSSLLNESCDNNEVGTKKPKKKRHKDTIEPVVQSSALVEYSAIESNVNDFLTNTNGKTKKKREKKRNKDITITSVLPDESQDIITIDKQRKNGGSRKKEISPLHDEHHKKTSKKMHHKNTELGHHNYLSSKDEIVSIQHYNINDQHHKKKRKKEHHKIVTDESELRHHKYLSSQNSCDSEMLSTQHNISDHKKKRKKHKDTATGESESGHHKHVTRNDSDGNEILSTGHDQHHKKRKREHHKDTAAGESESGHHKYFSRNDSDGNEILSTGHYNINDQHHKKKRKKEHHKDTAPGESESRHHKYFSPNDSCGSDISSTQHFNVNSEIEKKKTKRKREEATIDRVKSERIDEIENQINLTQFVLNETPQHIISERPVELRKDGVDKKRHHIKKEMQDSHTAQHALPQLDANLIGSTPVDCLDRAEKEKTGREQSNTTDTNLSHFVLNETPQHIVSERPAELVKDGVAQPQLAFDVIRIGSTEGSTPVNCVDHTEKEKTKDDHNNNEREERQKHSDEDQIPCENTSTVESCNSEQVSTKSNISKPGQRKHNETPSDTLKRVDFVKNFLDKPSVRTKLTEDNKQLLENLHVTIPFDIPLSHLIETRMSSHPTKKQQKQFKELGLTMNTTHYNQVEDNIIKNNWENFCKMHNLPNDPKPFMSFEACSDTKMNGSILSKPERIKFVQFLGQKLEHRYLYGIYRRFKKLYEVVKKGRFTKTEDDLIWDYIQQSDDTNQFSKLAYVLNRDRHRILMRYRLLKAQREPGRDKK